MNNIECLLFLLENNKNDKETQTAYLEAYIGIFGPIPNEYGDKIKELLKPLPK